MAGWAWIPTGSHREVSGYVIAFLLSQASPGALRTGHTLTDVDRHVLKKATAFLAKESR